MTKPRTSLINIETTPFYHLINRTVRKAFLCGIDKHTGQSFEHRRQWMVDRIRLLSSTFAIDVASYAVMSNHYHLVIRVNVEERDEFTDLEVVERWQRLYSGDAIMTAWRKGEDVNRLYVNEKLIEWRKRLGDISWFMRCLNEFMAHKANKEDQCTGKFWEGRFKSQALLDEKAIISCMAYVDLNPVRAKMAASAETSEFTSIYERIHQKASEVDEHFCDEDITLKPLMPFEESQSNKSKTNAIGFSMLNYFELVDLTGRVIRAEKSGFIHNQEPELLSKLGFTSKQWLHQSKYFGKTDKYRRLTAVGNAERMSDMSLILGKRCISGQCEIKNIYH